MMWTTNPYLEVTTMPEVVWFFELGASPFLANLMASLIVFPLTATVAVLLFWLTQRFEEDRRQRRRNEEQGQNEEHNRLRLALLAHEFYTEVV